MRGEARKFIAPQWSLGARFNYDKSSDFTQWQAEVGLRYLMDGRVSP
ncbi:cellulose synthase subunit BcsC-related outer membrane protein [Nitrospirota bacterium]